MQPMCIVPCGRLPISLACFSDGSIAFLHRDADVLFDQPEAGIQAVFAYDSFYIGNDGDVEEFPYNTPIPYKEHHNLLKWLQQQQMEMPTFI